MKNLFAAIVLGLFSVTAIADPCMDANVTPLGHAADMTPGEVYLDQDDC